MNLRHISLALMLAGVTALPVAAVTAQSANAATAEDLNNDADQALQTLFKTNSVAESISKSARAVLVFPKVIKAGFIFGGSYGRAFSGRGLQS